MLVSCKKCSVRVHASEYLSPALTGTSCLLEAVVTEWPSQSPAAKDAFVFLGNWWLVEIGCFVALASCQRGVSGLWVSRD